MHSICIYPILFECGDITAQSLSLFYKQPQKKEITEVISNEVELPGFEPRTTEPKSAVLPLHHSSIRCSKATAKVAKKSEFAKTTPRNRDFASEIDLFSHCARLEILLLRITPLCTTINIPLSFEIECPQVRAHAFVFFKEKL